MAKFHVKDETIDELLKKLKEKEEECRKLWILLGKLNPKLKDEIIRGKKTLDEAIKDP